MKKSFVFLSIALAFSAANATGKPPTQPQYPQTNEYNSYNLHPTANAAAFAGAAALSASRSASNSTVSGSGNSTATGGLGGLGGTASVVAPTSVEGSPVTIQGVGNSEYKAASAPAYAPDGSAPRTSCRIFMGLGGSGRDGSLSGGIPIGNDQTCLSGANIEFMDKVNKVKAGTFTDVDYLREACKVEGMSEATACKNLQAAK